MNESGDVSIWTKPLNYSETDNSDQTLNQDQEEILTTEPYSMPKLYEDTLD